MDTEEHGHLVELRCAHVKRLRILELKQAKMGLSAPEYVFTEIEDLQEKIAAIDVRLNGSFHSAPPPSASTPSPTVQVDIVFKGDFVNLTPDLQEKMIGVLAVLAGISADQIRLVKAMSGSIVLRVEMPKEAADRLLELHSMQDADMQDAEIEEITESLEHRSVGVVIILRNPVIRSGVRSIIERYNKVNILGVGENFEEAVSLVKELQPDVVLLDLSIRTRLDERSLPLGLAAIREIHQVAPQARILAFSALRVRGYSSGFMYEVFASGIDGYLVLEDEIGPDFLIDALQQVMRGERYYTESAASAYSNFSALTAHELRVLRQVALGVSNDEIAALLSISKKAVGGYIRSILRRLDLRSREDLQSPYLDLRK